MTRHENEQIVRKYFTDSRPRFVRLAARFVDDERTAIDEAAAIFDRMLPDMAYVDKPHHTMAPALFICCTNLAMYLALKARGVNVHDFGSAMLTGLARAPMAVPEEPKDEAALQEDLAMFTKIAEESQQDAAPGEDVFEVVMSEEAEFDYGYNVKSCAVCYAYSKYDATDLVPYMCAVDDVVSDRGAQGLRRTGSIALGAHECDFRYKRGGEPLHLADQYPDQIRLTPVGD